MHANHYPQKFEFIEEVRDSKSAMNQFIGRFFSSRQPHEYLADTGIQGLEFDTDDGVLQVRFIEMPADYWRATYRRRRLTP